MGAADQITGGMWPTVAQDCAQTLQTFGFCYFCIFHGVSSSLMLEVGRIGYSGQAKLVHSWTCWRHVPAECGHICTRHIWRLHGPENRLFGPIVKSGPISGQTLEKTRQPPERGRDRERRPAGVQIMLRCVISGIYPGAGRGVIRRSAFQP